MRLVTSRATSLLEPVRGQVGHRHPRGPGQPIQPHWRPARWPRCRELVGVLPTTTRASARGVTPITDVGLVARWPVTKTSTRPLASTSTSPTCTALGNDRPMSIPTAPFDATSAKAPTSRSTHKTISTSSVTGSTRFLGESLSGHQPKIATMLLRCSDRLNSPCIQLKLH